VKKFRKYKRSVQSVDFAREFLDAAMVETMGYLLLQWAALYMLR